ncbi:MAG: hypothetical protein KDC38_18880, partial [Planctomycetes bacterium]|nr:hypothetical protein [Planctomycetota bacterium]
MDGLLRKRSVRLTLLLLIVLAALAGVIALRDIFTPLLLGFLIAYVLDPFADGLENARLPRLGAVIVIFSLFTVFLFALTTVGGMYAAQGIAVGVQRVVGERELKPFPEDGPPEPGVHFEDDSPKNGKFDPGYWDRTKSYFASVKKDLYPEWQESIEVTLEGISEWIDELREKLSSREDRVEAVKDTLDSMADWAGRTLAYRFRDDRLRDQERAGGQSAESEDQGPGLFSFVSFVLLLPFYVFFFLLEMDRIVDVVRRHLPAEQRPTIERIATQID